MEKLQELVHGSVIEGQREGKYLKAKKTLAYGGTKNKVSTKLQKFFSSLEQLIFSILL